jgi:hypothetical protein
MIDKVYFFAVDVLMTASTCGLWLIIKDRR